VGVVGTNLWKVSEGKEPTTKVKFTTGREYGKSNCPFSSKAKEPVRKIVFSNYEILG